MCHVVNLVGKTQCSVKHHQKDAGSEIGESNGRARSEKDFISTEMGRPSHRGFGEVTGQGGYR